MPDTLQMSVASGGNWEVGTVPGTLVVREVVSQLPPPALFYLQKVQPSV